MSDFLRQLVKLGQEAGLIKSRTIVITNAELGLPDVEQDNLESRIQILDEGGVFEITKDELGYALEKEIEVFDEVGGDGVIDLSDIEVLSTRFGMEATPKIMFDIATNTRTAQVFCQRLRENLIDIYRIKQIGELDTKQIQELQEQQKREFSSSTLTTLSYKLGIPLNLIRLGEGYGAHFNLGLKNPENVNGMWRILAYDPMDRVERYINLQNWNPETYRAENIMIQKSDWWDQLEIQDLSLSSEDILAEHFELVKAKMARFQEFGDVINCGPLSLYASCLRAAFQLGDNPFKSWGRQLLEEYTQLRDEDGNRIPGSGIKIYSYEEIMNGWEWNYENKNMDGQIKVL